MKNKKGFTLVEIIVVVVILGILLAIAIPNVIGYIDQANAKADGLAVRNVYLAAVSAQAEAYGKDVTAKATPAEIQKLAGITTAVVVNGDAAATNYAVTVTGNEVTSVVMGSSLAKTGKTVTYTPGTGVTIPD